AVLGVGLLGVALVATGGGAPGVAEVGEAATASGGGGGWGGVDPLEHAAKPSVAQASPRKTALAVAQARMPRIVRAFVSLVHLSRRAISSVPRCPRFALPSPCSSPRAARVSRPSSRAQRSRQAVAPRAEGARATIPLATPFMTASAGRGPGGRPAPCAPGARTPATQTPPTVTRARR